MSKLASLILIVGGSLLFVGAAAAQGDPGYSSGPQPVYAAPGGATVGPRAEGGGIKDNAGHHRPLTVSAMLATPWRYGFGVGLTAGVEIPVVHNGFIPAINNAFSIEPFITIAWSNYNSYGGFGLLEDNFHAWTYTPGVAGLWSFYFSPQLRVYGAVRLGVTVVSPVYDGPADNVDLENDADFFFEIAPGIVYSLTERVALRADIGWWSGIKGGVTILL